MNQVTILSSAQETPITFSHPSDDRSLLRSALKAGVGFPYECHSGGCGSCRFELVEGEVEVLWPEAPGLSARDRARKRYLACQCLAKTPLTIRVGTGESYRPAIAPRSFQARLMQVEPLTHDLFELRFQAAGPAEFLPGQYALLHVPAGTRAYSLSNTANAAGEWHFQIRHVPGGRGSDYLTRQLQPGQSLEIEGPYGLAHLRPESPRDIVCVAGGSGLAPVVSIARGASESGMLGSRQLHFFYGGRTPRDICGEHLLRQLPQYGQAIHYHPVVSAGAAQGPEGWQGATGFVHDHVRDQLGARLGDFEFYFAGPPPMSQALQEMLMIDYKVPHEQIHFDRFF